jgi:hypothetical protein
VNKPERLWTFLAVMQVFGGSGFTNRPDPPEPEILSFVGSTSALARVGCSNVWTFIDGTATAGSGSDRSTFSPGSTASPSLLCAAINATGPTAVHH